MRWASAISREADTALALDALASALRFELPAGPDLVLGFATPQHSRAYTRLPRLVAERFPRAVFAGCSGQGVIGGREEIDGAPALALLAAELPGVALAAFHLRARDVPEPEDVAGWQARLGSSDPRTHVLVLCDPFSCEVEPALAGLDRAFPLGRKLGGLASGGRLPQSNALFAAAAFQHSGLAGVTLTGAIELDCVVAQGCRTIGEPMIVTRCDDNQILELDGRPALAVMRALYDALVAQDRKLFERALFVGIEMRDQRAYQAGDFLLRNVLAVDRDRGSVAVAARLERYQVVQLHLRDPAAAAADLARQLVRYRERQPAVPAGALLFPCLSRGAAFYGRPNHDSELVRAHLGPVPLAGFFANGEIGPVGPRTFLHGQTAVLALARAPDA